jgi:hypothetical protein
LSSAEMFLLFPSHLTFIPLLPLQGRFTQITIRLPSGQRSLGKVMAWTRPPLRNFRNGATPFTPLSDVADNKVNVNGVYKIQAKSAAA